MLVVMPCQFLYRPTVPILLSINKWKVATTETTVSVRSSIVISYKTNTILPEIIDST